MAEDQKWKDSRLLTVQVLKDFGVGKNSIENYVTLHVQELLDMMQVRKIGLKHDLCVELVSVC